MTGQSRHAVRLAEVVSLLAPKLKGSGFKKRRHTFNRETEPGLVHLLAFNMIGSYSAFHGLFGVELGVYIDEVHQALRRVPRPRFIPGYFCDLRKDLHEFVPGPPSHGWSLWQSADELASVVGETIERYGIPWLNSLSSRAAVIEAWGRDEDAKWPPAPRPLAVAAMRHAGGRRSEARALIEDYYQVVIDQRDMRHAADVRAVATQLGIELSRGSG